MTYAQRIEEAKAYQRLCDAARDLGVPTSLDDPRSPRTVEGLRAAVVRAANENVARVGRKRSYR